MFLADFLEAQLFSFFLVFARLGSAMIFMPGIGEQAVPVRYRLLFAVALSASLMPVTPVYGIEPVGPIVLVRYLAFEVTIGLWIGLTARILLSALQFAGYQIGLVAGLSNAFAPSIGSFEGSTMVASGMLMAGVALIFVTDLHHMIFEALLMTYAIFPVGGVMLADMSEQITKAVAKSFYIGVSITAPFYLMGLLLNLGLGLANRMMPNLPVFFVAIPVLIFLGILVLGVSAPWAFTGFLTSFEEWLARLAF